MAVSGISSASNQYDTSIQTASAQRRQVLQSLATSLQSGDLTSAQSALAKLQGLPAAGGQAQNGGPGQTTDGSGLQTLATALQSGDLAGAQAAFSALQKSHHGHHHHHGQGLAPATETSAGTASNQAMSSLLGSTLNVRA